MDIETPKELVEAFHLTWSTYPASASLVHKSRTIMAVNPACREGGREPGMNCAKWGRPEQHKGCLADIALKNQMPMSREVLREEGLVRVYWLPVPGYPEFYVHFSTEPLSQAAVSSKQSA